MPPALRQFESFRNLWLALGGSSLLLEVGAYDDANHLTGITQGTAGVGFVYDAEGRRTALNLPGGISAAYTYDAAGQLTGIAYTRAGVTIGDLAYQYDAAGRRIRESGIFAQRSMPGAVASAAYNAANQLTSWGGATLAYDLNGTLTSDGSRTYTWDSRNRLTAIAGAASASFGYDAFGRRSSATVSGVATSYLYDGGNVSRELTGASVKATILGGLGLDEIFQRTDAAGARTFLTDPLGSALALADNTGAVRTSYLYTPYGAATASGDTSSNPFQYTSRENDGTGLYFYRARYYSPVFSRFISEDPIGLDGGSNPYAYVSGDPLGLTDPMGECPWCAGAAIGGLLDLGMQLASNGFNFHCVSWGEVALSAALGAVGGEFGGAQRAGTEFSHWIPSRYFRPSSPYYKPWLPSWLNGELNGSYVSSARHYYHDPFRFPRGWQELGDKWPLLMQQLDRIPNWMKGGGAGAGAGAAAGGSGSCDCH
ncbi:MAG TPA: RHS repeat-associated core domain-containing protein [Thermoanaerobaculia bacterium]|nr:RHS repeat-associated core domain-containing protein [Thermoanaerobaculia bacterium]